MSILSSKENKSKDIRTNKVENELRQQCLQYRVQYIDREKDESRYKCRKRRKLMRENIQNAHASSKIIKNMESNGDDVDFVVEFLDMEGNSFRVPSMVDQNEINMNESSFLQEGNSFHAPSMTDQNEINMNESSFLHANTEVHKMVQMFNDGVLNHSVATCLTCHEIRPQFHATKPSEKFHTENRKPHEVPSWVINKGRCKRCHKVYLANKNKSDYIFTFSGKYSNTNVCDFLTQNNMHFGAIPPFLSNLTFVESLMVRKISVAMYIHTLKYGALASKGHAVAVPQDMVSQPLNNYHLYYENDHCSGTQLKGKYFLYLPNSYYWDVTIDESRLNMLPRVPSPVQLPTIKIHDDPEFQGEDNGPSKHQFDTLHENEEIVSLSGITVPINTKDADDELKILGRHRLYPYLVVGLSLGLWLRLGVRVKFRV